MAPKLFISANSLKPTGFMGWPDLALALLQKYTSKILLTEDSLPRESIEEFLKKNGISLSGEEFVTEIDAADPDITLLTMEPATSISMPSIAGQVFGSVCGPFGLDWNEQIRICRERKVAGLISEILADELSAKLAGDDLEYFCRNALFLPPCINPNPSDQSKKTYDTIILAEGESITESKIHAKIKNIIPTLEKLDEFEIIQYSRTTDFKKIFEEFGKAQAIYNLLHYPQLTLFLKLMRGNPTLLNQESSTDSPLRNFLSDYSPLEYESDEELKQVSVRTQVLKILAKKQTDVTRSSKEVLSHFDSSSLLPYLEQKLNLKEKIIKDGRLDLLHSATSWESLVDCKVHFRQFPNFEIDFEENPSRVDSYLHPAGSSALISLAKKKNEFGGDVFLNPIFAQKVLSLPYNSSTTSLFIELLEYDHFKWIESCKASLSKAYTNRLAELLYSSCLLAKDKTLRDKRIGIATEALSGNFQVNGDKMIELLTIKSKLSFLKSETDFMEEFSSLNLSEPKSFITKAILQSEQECYLPKFRNNAVKYLEHFLCFINKNQEVFDQYTNQSFSLLCMTGRIEEGFELVQSFASKGYVPEKYVLQYLVRSYLFSGNKDVVVPLFIIAEKDILKSKSLDPINLIFKLILYLIKGDESSLSKTVQELFAQAKHISNISPPTLTVPLAFLLLGKGLNSKYIEERALRFGNNQFFTYLNDLEFGEVPTISSQVRSKLNNILSEFIADSDYKEVVT